MRFSEKWLREWVNPALSTDELVAQITMAGLEVDSVEPVAGEFSGVVVAEIISTERHPDAAKLQVCLVNAGDAEPLQIVCGASNARAGIKIPCAKIGAVLPGDFKIKRAKLRGVESFGMLCAAQELGLEESSDGLMELPETAPIGRSIESYLALDDKAIDVDLTPNRGDCLGIAGLAREIGVLNRCDVTPVICRPVKQTINDTFKVEVAAAQQCPRYVGRVVQGVDLIKPTPVWMVERLRRSGIRSIDAVVDVTNYVLLELGQPMHAFDLHQLKGGIHVRMANEGEQLTLLDGQTITLASDVLVIADQERPLAMAGVMGGIGSGVGKSTRSIFLESAFFDPIAIAGKARRYGLHTDSSHRFERGVDFELQRHAIERATALLLDIVGGDAGPLIEVMSAENIPHLHSIQLRRDRINRILGCDIPDNDIEDILGRLGMDMVSTTNGWHIVPPSYRFDIRLEVDLIEELGRVYGYDNLPTSMPILDAFSPPREESLIPVSQLKTVLVDRGYQEVITYSFVDKKYIELLTPQQHSVALANPISADMSEMRTTLWAGLLKTASYNINRQQPRLKLFERGLNFLQEETGLQQKDYLAGLLYGGESDESWFGKARPVDFYDAKGDVEALLALTGGEHVYRFESGAHPALHPGQTAVIKRGDEVVGFLGALHPSVQKSLDLPQKAFLYELALDGIRCRSLPQFKELSKYPEVRRDFAVIVDEKISAQSILKNVREMAGDLLTGLVLFDVYQGDNLEAGKKSIAFGITLQDPNRTLQDEDINPLVERVVSRLKELFNVTLRE
ncbi:phenylalanine--tRNA ligase subunit beta [Ketobacter sp. MCCC 1A13808]|uniref:phenylalanine--tRNA ligase subunit beta n=1 Tax=Ketobacter sp. MCCC 1A13808 TaxID=2602738 RepID=UPI0012EBA0BF|nr:phenylalanine--tRNA ligase subunit beta [Ketobacter sp. MCCC 1A13808]MVF12946.1 phenylalanine--tRNA ligase subunit beta [Ketobacter sp. MCCC 1A13808]